MPPAMETLRWGTSMVDSDTHRNDPRGSPSLLSTTATRDQTERGPIRRTFCAGWLQIDPDSRPRLGVAQLDLGWTHARRRETDDLVSPPMMGDGVSDQHVPQSPLPRRRPSQLRDR